MVKLKCWILSVKIPHGQDKFSPGKRGVCVRHNCQTPRAPLQDFQLYFKFQLRMQLSLFQNPAPPVAKCSSDRNGRCRSKRSPNAVAQ